jgi:hypothetical protein
MEGYHMSEESKSEIAWVQSLRPRFEESLKPCQIRIGFRLPYADEVMSYLRCRRARGRASGSGH